MSKRTAEADASAVLLLCRGIKQHRNQITEEDRCGDP